MGKDRLRNFCFTNFNLPYDYTTLTKMSSYLVYGVETCPKTQKKHHQGYCELKNQTAFSTVQKSIQGCHIEKRKGTAMEAANYCKKGDDNLYSGENVTEIGEISKGGTRTDIKSTYEYAKENKSLIQFIDETQPNLQDIKIFQIAKQCYQQERRFKPEVTWLYGSTGTGKTRYVMELENDLWVSGRNLKWWEGYENQEATLFDDFRKDFCTFHELLRILDRYPYTVEIKGGSAKLNSKRMYITSCYHPQDMYDTREDVTQLLRRIDTIIELHADGTQTQTQRSGGNTKPPTSDEVSESLDLCLI